MVEELDLMKEADDRHREYELHHRQLDDARADHAKAARHAPGKGRDALDDDQEAFAEVRKTVREACFKDINAKYVEWLVEMNRRRFELRRKRERALAAVIKRR